MQRNLRHLRLCVTHFHPCDRLTRIKSCRTLHLLASAGAARPRTFCTAASNRMPTPSSTAEASVQAVPPSPASTCWSPRPCGPNFRRFVFSPLIPALIRILKNLARSTNNRTQIHASWLVVLFVLFLAVLAPCRSLSFCSARTAKRTRCEACTRYAPSQRRTTLKKRSSRSSPSPTQKGSSLPLCPVVLSALRRPDVPCLRATEHA